MATSALAIVCKGCRNPLPVVAENTGLLDSCATCKNPVRIDLFPRLKPAPPPAEPQPLEVEDQATCYFHAHYQAEVPCEDCGRFLCRLCDVSFHGGHRCVVCIEQMQKKPDPLLITADVRWSTIAILILLVSIPFWFLSFITLPVALVIFFKFGRRRDGVFPPSTLETVAFVFIALCICAMVVALVASVFVAVLAA